ncbi:MAG: dTDP-glucose 4,6-dehydratase [Caulobacteraceae bacterium]|nr:dTDP-glucose 4,6-dehydratase [Caulobacteraceae bacterium]
MNILVTGGLGFIGSNFIKYIINKKEINIVINVDTITKQHSAANKKNVKDFENNLKYKFHDFWLETLDNFLIKDQFKKIIKEYSITHVVHFAAESHVDNSISHPRRFVQSNILGTFNLLEIIRDFPEIRFHHISTDEVYGSLGEEGKFTETTAYAPNSPYSASKAASDMLVRAYNHTFKVLATISNCSNNYGPNQHNEKFIPVVINSILNNKKIPVYGNGKNIRDWIFVEDHCEAVWFVLNNGKIGETYNVGGNCEKTNLEIINDICQVLNVNPQDYISFVEDRKGHDFRYAIDNTKISKELNWHPKTSFNEGLKQTVEFYKNRS